MEATGLKLPETLEEDELLVLPATWEEYLSLVDEAPYTIQYLNGEIIMSQATDIHEELVGIIIWLLNSLYIQRSDYRVMGSNVKIVIPGHKGDFNADVSVVKKPVDYGTTPTGRPSQVQIKNPEIVVEVLSRSTRKFDMGEKLNYYKLIPSLQHIVFVEQNSPFVSAYSRTAVPDEWLNHDYRTLESTVRLGDLDLPLEAIYRKTVFEK